MRGNAFSVKGDLNPSFIDSAVDLKHSHLRQAIRKRKENNHGGNVGDPQGLLTVLGRYHVYSSISVNLVAQKMGMSRPFSLAQMSNQLNAIPFTKSFTEPVVTPEGTPLGGSVTLNISSDGSYTVEFVMHSSSDFAAFDFQLRAYVSSPEFPTFFFYHAGHVSGLGPDDTHPEAGSNPLIVLYWNQIVNSGKFSVAHDYQWSGAVGTLAGLVDDLLDLGASAVGGALGVVIALTQEAIGWVGATLGPGGTFGVIGGALVFAVGAIAGLPLGTALILGAAAGALTGVVANAEIQYRAMLPPEIALAQKVFGSTLPYDNIQLTNFSGLGGRAFTAPGVDGKTYCNLGLAFNNPLGPGGSAYRNNGELLIHELTHAWQIAHNSFIPGFVCSAIVNQTNYVMGDDVYAYGSSGPPWSSFNLEQQAQIVNQWFAGDGNQSGKPMDPNGYYARYIAGNILAGASGFSTSWL
jgi:hypothetical protein